MFCLICFAECFVSRTLKTTLFYIFCEMFSWMFCQQSARHDFECFAQCTAYWMFCQQNIENNLLKYSAHSSAEYSTSGAFKIVFFNIFSAKRSVSGLPSEHWTQRVLYVLSYDLLNILLNSLSAGHSTVCFSNVLIFIITWYSLRIIL